MSDERLFRRRKAGRPAGPWYVWGYDAEGNRWQETTGQVSEKAARAVAREIELRHASPAAAAAHEATLGPAVDAVLDGLKARVQAGKRSAGTEHFYGFKLGHWRRLWGDGMRLARINAALVDKAVETRRAEGASENTIHKELGALRVMLKTAKRAGLWAGDVAAVLPVAHAPEYVPRSRWLTSADLQRLFAKLPPNGAALVAFIVATGARWSEAERAQPQDINTDEGYVDIRGTKTKASVRTVPIVHAEARSLLDYAIRHAGGRAWASEHPADEVRLFAPWPSPNHALARACIAAKIEHASFNDLRRTFATWLREAGATPDLIAPAMGHTTTAMVQKVYARLSAAALKDLLSRQMRGSEGAAPSAANVQQTECTSADSAASTDQPRNAKSPVSRASAVRCDGLEPSANGLRVRSDTPVTSAKTPTGKAVPLWPVPRKARRAANVQQSNKKPGEGGKR